MQASRHDRFRFGCKASIDGKCPNSFKAYVSMLTLPPGVDDDLLVSETAAARTN